MIKHVWWDLDSTLYKPNKVLDDARSRMLYQEYARIMGKKLDANLIDEYKFLLQKSKSNSKLFHQLGKSFDYIDKLILEVPVEDFIQEQSVAVKLIRSLNKMGVKNSIYSNSPKAYVLKVIGLLGFRPSDFAYILSAKEAGHKKPDLGGFHKLIKISGILAEEILFVGDRLAVDILPAKKVGLRTAIVWSQNKPRSADFAFKSISAMSKSLTWLE